MIPDDDFVVVAVRPQWRGSGVLLVLTGTGNDTRCDTEGYAVQVFFTWCHGYESNPVWLPRLLVLVARSFMLHHRPCDVLALSRGVQAML